MNFWKRTLSLSAALFLMVFSGPPALAAFSDTAGYEWENSINYLQENGIVSGNPDGSFTPYDRINRAAFTKIIIEASYGTPGPEYDRSCFDDVKKGDWYAPYICFAAEEGIVSGYGGTRNFGPGDNITQPAALKVIFNTLNQDVWNSGGEWYDMWLDHAEWIGMYYFEPNAAAAYEITRGEAAYFMTWMLTDEWIDQIDADSFYGSDDYWTYDEDWWDDYDYEFDEDFTFGMTEEDCYEDEVYDPELELCYVEWGEEDYDWDYDLDEWDYEGAEDPEEVSETTLAVYSVDGDVIELISSHSSDFDESEHQLMWDYFAQLIPAEYRESITRFEVFTDGQYNMLGAVQTNMDNALEWTLFLDLEDSVIDGELEPYELPLTIVHEYAHVLSLSDDQIPIDSWDDPSCNTLMLYEGCLEDDAYLFAFYEEFWEGVDPESSATYWGSEDEFVTEYAATNVVEDFAESFTYFVFEDRPRGSSIADEKMEFFYQFDELVALRQLIRQRL